MDPYHLIVAVYCLVDDTLKTVAGGQRLRARGPDPILSDAEVLTMEIVGEYLKMDQDTQIFAYFRWHHKDLFPAICRVHRTTFVRQAANLWRVKDQLWSALLLMLPHDPSITIVDSMPIQVCHFARARFSKLFRGDAAYGYDHTRRQTFYGFRLHMAVKWPGVPFRASLAPANVSELEVLPQLVEGSPSITIGDANYWSPVLREELRTMGIQLLTPFKHKSKDPAPKHLQRFLSHVRYRIETVYGHLTDYFNVKRIWARDLWHLSSRVIRKLLALTVGLLFNVSLGRGPLQIRHLAA